ncbi:hypothetical protein Xvie_02767 [Xenorhabdus vietnamensis]|uniref:Uncharacterized protein n=1 Tax=Xenorhabdus vietnamensis TaxID=351656 RepID=A0A1Y2S9Y2_9GAMM|nr:hypothetical protein Xvie_02767 [Xenorhabdus vietnamensis]
MDILAGFFLTIFEIFYKIIKYTLKFLAWIFKISVKNITISLLSISILFLIIFSAVMTRFLLNILLLSILVCFIYKFRGRIKNYLNKKGIMDYFK